MYLVLLRFSSVHSKSLLSSCHFQRQLRWNFSCQMIIMQIKLLKDSDITNLMREITRKLIHIQVEKNKILQVPYLFRNLSRWSCCNNTNFPNSPGISPDKLLADKSSTIKSDNSTARLEYCPIEYSPIEVSYWASSVYPTEGVFRPSSYSCVSTNLWAGNMNPTLAESKMMFWRWWFWNGVCSW